MKTISSDKNFPGLGSSFMARIISGAGALILLFAASSANCGQTNFYKFTVIRGQAQFYFQTNASVYYIIQSSTDLKTFTPISIALGRTGPVFTTLATNTRQFFALSAPGTNSTTSTIGDGISDMFKLLHGLNPLDPSVAGSSSGITGITGVNLTWLTYYEQQAGLYLTNADANSRENSVFNFGAPTAPLEAISREVSLFNGQSPALVLVPQEVYSRELSIFNEGQPTAAVETMSREVSVFNGQSPSLTTFQETLSREVSVFNAGAPTGPLESISREVSVFNSL